MPDRKFTPSGDKPFENGMNSLRFLRVCSMWWAKVNFASRNNPRVDNRGKRHVTTGDLNSLRKAASDWPRRGERFIYSHRNERSERKL
ncbi:hypothetical protein TNCV_733171 [Trichonephila clavipes]|nr:hypothetical protein TNCV_733171 [Trichonephila clavipes]